MFEHESLQDDLESLLGAVRGLEAECEQFLGLVEDNASLQPVGLGHQAGPAEADGLQLLKRGRRHHRTRLYAGHRTLELSMNLHEHFTITEKAHTQAFSWLAY